MSVDHVRRSSLLVDGVFRIRMREQRILLVAVVVMRALGLIRFLYFHILRDFVCTWLLRRFSYLQLLNL